MKLSEQQLRAMVRGRPNDGNLRSALGALNDYGARVGLDQPHRLAQYLPQILHESGGFRYDREIWGPTPAQARYDTRTDLGNTPARDGDGYKYRGRTGIQITGAANVRDFRDWCRKNISSSAPDFLESPDLMNTDPWEGLGPLWYWDTRGLNRYADQGDIETITRRINGGKNGYADRVDYYGRCALVLLGYGPDDVRAFQASAKSSGLYTGEIDGDVGPKTRSALHKSLVALAAPGERSSDVRSAPVVAREAVAPVPIDKPLTRTTGFWERVTAIVTSLGGGTLGLMLQDWRVIVAVGGFLIVLAALGLWQHKRIVDAVKSIKAEVS